MDWRQQPGRSRLAVGVQRCAEPELILRPRTNGLDDGLAVCVRACPGAAGVVAAPYHFSPSRCWRRRIKRPGDSCVSGLSKSVAALASPRTGRSSRALEGLHTGGAQGLARLVSLTLTAMIGGFLGYHTIRLGRQAIVEYWENGRSPTYHYLSDLHRKNFTFFLRLVVPLLYLLGILGVAGSAAASITSEHEEDTWVSLTATDLTDREIVFGKLLGALKRGGMLAAVIVLLSIIGVMANSISLSRFHA